MRKKSLRQTEVQALDKLCRDVAMILAAKYAVPAENGKSYGWRGPCEDCGKTRPLFAAHVYPKGVYASMRHVPDNVLPLCWYCHDRRWHAGITGIRWFEEKWPERGVRLSVLAKAKVKVDLAEARSMLEATIRRLLNGKNSVQEALGSLAFES